MRKVLPGFLLILGNCMYILFSFAFFRQGVLLLFPAAFVFQTLLSLANYYMTRRKRTLFFFDCLLVVTVVVSGWLDTWLYTSFVSNDDVSYSVGMFGVYAGVFYVLLLSLFFLQCRISTEKSKNK